MNMNDKYDAQLKAQAAIEVFERQDSFTILIEPLKKELLTLKSSYDCKTLIEMATLKGKKEGLSFILDRIEQIKREGQMAQEALQRAENKRILDSREIDSTDL